MGPFMAKDFASCRHVTLLFLQAGGEVGGRLCAQQDCEVDGKPVAKQSGETLSHNF